MYMLFIFLALGKQPLIIDLIKQFSEQLKNPPIGIPDYLVGVFWGLLLVTMAFVIIYKTVTKKRSGKPRKKVNFLFKFSYGEDDSTNDK